MIKLKIDGMTCDHCVSAVNEALAEVPGVTRVVEVSLDRGEAVVEGSPHVDELVQTVAEEGYETQVA